MLFHLSSRPEELGATIVRAMATQTLSSDLASPFALARLCFVLGHLAIKLLVYVEVKQHRGYSILVAREMDDEVT